MWGSKINLPTLMGFILDVTRSSVGKFIFFPGKIQPTDNKTNRLGTTQR